MSTEQQPTPTPQPPADPPAPQADAKPDTGPATDWQAEAEKWKALSRKHEEQSKANADKAKQFDALEEASKSELQKAQERAEAAERALQDATLTAMRATIAAEKGVPAALLSGTTEEELTAAADALLAFRGQTPTAPSANGQGPVGAPIKGHEDPIKDLDERIAEADRTRNFTLAIQLKRERAALAAASPKN